MSDVSHAHQHKHAVDDCAICGERVLLDQTAHLNPTHAGCGTLRDRIAELEALLLRIEKERNTRIVELEVLLQEIAARLRFVGMSTAKIDTYFERTQTPVGERSQEHDRGR